MNSLLIPRIEARAAEERLLEIQQHLITGGDPNSLVELDPREAIPNPTGGLCASPADIETWRLHVRTAVSPISTNDKVANDRHGLELGRALNRIVNPIPGDAGHDGVWSFLSLYVFPDIVNERWSLTITKDSERRLSPDRWIGAQMTGARDRNYIKTSWLRYSILGDVMESAKVPLGEDEFGGLLERTAVSRNRRLVKVAAGAIVSYSGPRSRMEFTRDLMKSLCYQTGARSLDLLNDEDLQVFVESAARRTPRTQTTVHPATTSLPRRAADHPGMPSA